MRKLFLAVLGIWVVSGGVAFGAGSVTTPSYDDGTIVEYRSGDGKLFRDIVWTWSSTSGTATASGGVVKHQTGLIMKILAVPSGTNLPDPSYDVEILNLVDRDVLNKDALNRPQNDASPENLITPYDDAGDRLTLTNDSIRFSGTNLNTSGTAGGDFHLLIEVWNR